MKDKIRNIISALPTYEATLRLKSQERNNTIDEFIRKYIADNLYAVGCTTDILIKLYSGARVTSDEIFEALINTLLSDAELGIIAEGYDLITNSKYLSKRRVMFDFLKNYTDDYIERLNAIKPSSKFYTIFHNNDILQYKDEMLISIERDSVVYKKRRL